MPFISWVASLFISWATRIEISASALLMDIESGLATIDADIGGPIKKVGKGTIVLSGNNVLTSIEILEGLIKIKNIQNMGSNVPIIIRNSGQLDVSGLIFSGIANEYLILSSDNLFTNAISDAGIVQLSENGEIPGRIDTIGNNTALLLSSTAHAGAISNPISFSNSGQLILEAEVPTGVIKAPLTFSSLSQLVIAAEIKNKPITQTIHIQKDAKIILRNNATDKELLGDDGAFAIYSGAKIVLGASATWNTDITIR